jgi:hypothetical protein
MVKPSESADNEYQNPLEKLAEQGFNRENNPLPNAPIALASDLPIAKVTHSAAVGAVVTIIVYLFKVIWSIEIPIEVSGAAIVIATAITSWYVPIKRRELK